MRGSHSISSKKKATDNHVTANRAPQKNISAQHARAQHSKPPQSSAVKAPAIRNSGNYNRNTYSNRRRRSHSKKPVIAIIAVVCIIALAVGGFLAFGPKSKTGTVKQGAEIVVSVPTGAPTVQIAETLVDNGVIPSSAEFVNHVEKAGQSSSLQSGTYVFTGGQDIDTIVRMMTNGETGRMLTIPEGFTLKQIASKVEETCGIKADEFYALTQQAPNYVRDYPFLDGVYNGSMEGFLYPDTYRVEVDATADDVIRGMLDQFKNVIASVGMSYASSKNLTLYDVVTLASMIEKEYRAPGDMPLISSVFYNRLREGIVLGSDITTYYAVGKELTDELTNEDLMSDSPYNTRHPQHYGLPAGPICSPSVEALNAAANPAQTDYFYFFYSEKQNQTMFFTNEADFSAAWAVHGS